MLYLAINLISLFFIILCSFFFFIVQKKQKALIISKNKFNTLTFEISLTIFFIVFFIIFKIFSLHVGFITNIGITFWIPILFYFIIGPFYLSLGLIIANIVYYFIFPTGIFLLTFSLGDIMIIFLPMIFLYIYNNFAFSKKFILYLHSITFLFLLVGLFIPIFIFKIYTQNNLIFWLIFVFLIMTIILIANFKNFSYLKNNRFLNMFFFINFYTIFFISLIVDVISLWFIFKVDFRILFLIRLLYFLPSVILNTFFSFVIFNFLVWKNKNTYFFIYLNKYERKLDSKNDKVLNYK